MNLSLSLFNTKAATSSQGRLDIALRTLLMYGYVMTSSRTVCGLKKRETNIFIPQRLWFTLRGYSGGSVKVLLISDIDHWGPCETCFAVWAGVNVSLFTTIFIIFVSNLVQCFLFDLHILATNWHFRLLSFWSGTVLVDNFNKTSFGEFSIIFNRFCNPFHFHFFRTFIDFW